MKGGTTTQPCEVHVVTHRARVSFILAAFQRSLQHEPHALSRPTLRSCGKDRAPRESLNAHAKRWLPFERTPEELLVGGACRFNYFRNLLPSRAPRAYDCQRPTSRREAAQGYLHREVISLLFVLFLAILLLHKCGFASSHVVVE